MKVLDLFSGIGGFSLGLERAGMRTIAFCESDNYARRVLRKHWSEVPIYDDIKTLNGYAFRGPVDLICGGFPCQPYSTAARGRNNAECLWPEFRRIVREIRPSWVVAENVPGLGNGGIERIARNLEVTHKTWCFDIDTALPEKQRGRNRTIFLAHADREGKSQRPIDAQMASLSPLAGRVREDYPGAVGVATRLPHRMDRLRCLGNSVVPQIVEIIGRAIMEIDNGS